MHVAKGGRAPCAQAWGDFKQAQPSALPPSCACASKASWVARRPACRACVLLSTHPPACLPACGRGAVAVEIEVVTARTDVHSGLAGGAVQNPARALAQLLASFWHPGNLTIAIQGFYDNVRPITDADRWAVLPARSGWGGGLRARGWGRLGWLELHAWWPGMPAHLPQITQHPL